jgi:hypothetical protein
MYLHVAKLELDVHAIGKQDGVRENVASALMPQIHLVGFGCAVLE